MLQLNTNVQEAGTGPRWYLSNEKGLDNITDKSSNPEIGIVSMKVTAATGKGPEAGAVAQVWLTTVVGSMQVSVFRVKGQDALRLVVPQDKYVKDGEDAYSDIFQLVRPVRAQILRHVHKLCEATPEPKAEVAPAAQAQTQAPAGMDAATLAMFQQFMAFQQMSQQAGAGAAVGAGATAEAPFSAPDEHKLIGSDNEPF